MSPKTFNVIAIGVLVVGAFFSLIYFVNNRTVKEDLDEVKSSHKLCYDGVLYFNTRTTYLSGAVIDKDTLKPKLCSSVKQ